MWNFVTISVPTIAAHMSTFRMKLNERNYGIILRIYDEDIINVIIKQY